MKCIAGAKVQLFCDTSVYYKTDSQKQNRENSGKQRLSDRSVPVNHPKFFEKLFSGVKVGLKVKRERIAPHALIPDTTCSYSGRASELEVDERLHLGADELIDDENGQDADDAHDGEG